jgi:hypothetical protein
MVKYLPVVTCLSQSQVAENSSTILCVCVCAKGTYEKKLFPNFYFQSITSKFMKGLNLSGENIKHQTHIHIIAILL